LPLGIISHHGLACCGNDVQIAEIGVILMECASPMTAGDERSVLDWANHLSTAAEASRLAVRLHLLTLLFAVRYMYNDTLTICCHC